MWKKIGAYGCAGLFVTLLAALIWFGVEIGWPLYLGAKERMDFPAEVRKQVDPVELQKWAVGIIKSGESALISKDQMPASVRKIGSYGPGFATLSTRDDSKLAVQIFWGSGFGHWGLIIGDKDFKVSSSDNEEVTPWVSGIYFFEGD